MDRATLLRLLLEFGEKRLWWSKEELFVWLWRRGYRCRFETVARYLRDFARQGLVIKRFKNGNLEYHANRYAIRMYLRSRFGS